MNKRRPKFCFLIALLFCFSTSLICQEVVKDLITPDKKRILLPEATESLFFIIKSKPDTVINIELTADNTLFTNFDKQTADNFISDYLIIGKVAGTAFDETVEKKFELTLEQVKTLGKSKKKEGYRIYYRALVLGPENEEGESDITHWSFSDEDWENAPSVIIFKTHDAQMGWDTFMKGEEYFKQEEYAKAIEEYESAFFYLPDPIFIYNIGICHRRLAIQHFEEFLEYPEIEEKYRQKAKELIQQLRGEK